MCSRCSQESYQSATPGEGPSSKACLPTGVKGRPRTCTHTRVQELWGSTRAGAPTSGYQLSLRSFTVGMKAGDGQD